MLPHLRLFNPQGPDRVATLRAEPAWPAQDRFTLLVARGTSRTSLRKATILGPFDVAGLTSRMAEEAEALRRQGFLPGGLEALLTALASDGPRDRALAAVRLGWRRDAEAVEPLLLALANAGLERASLLDALGLIGDPRAIPAARQEAEKKLLSRRRSGVEALRNLGDTEGLAAARDRAIERLPMPLREIAAAAGADPSAIASALAALPHKDRGLALDTLYELGMPATTDAVRTALASLDIDGPHVWRYVKSVFKRSLLRRDVTTFAVCAYRIERTARVRPGTDAELKSGLDGTTRKTPVFRQRTQRYMMRLSWRHLRQLARHQPELYAPAAAEILLQYRPTDATEPDGVSGSLASCHLLHRILWGRSSRFELVRSSLTHRFRSKKPTTAPKGLREESYPELWDETPRAYIRLLATAKLREVHEFAVAAVKRAHRRAVEEAAPEDVVAFLSAPYEETVEIGLVELNRRFDPRAPDLALLQALAGDGRPPVRELAMRWLEISAPVWAADAHLIARLLGARDQAVRETVARLAVAELGGSPEVRAALAKTIAARLLEPESEPGLHDGYASVAVHALLAELTPLVPMDDLVVLLATGSAGARSVAGALLARHPEAIGSIGLARLAELGSHEVASLRESVRALLRLALPSLHADPSPLFSLAESDWPDARAFALGLLRDELAPSLGRSVALGFLDSRRVDVQDLGRDLLFRHADDLGGVEIDGIVDRLAQHTHRNVHRVALQLLLRTPPARVSLRPGLLPLFRSALFDLAPDGTVKRSLLDLLRAAGVRDEGNARFAVELLSDFVGTEGKRDFEVALAALVEIRLAFPQLPSAVTLAGGASA